MVNQESLNKKQVTSAGVSKVKEEPADDPVVSKWDYASATMVKQEYPDEAQVSRAGTIKAKEKPPEEPVDSSWEFEVEIDPLPATFTAEHCEAPAPLIDIVKCEPTIIQTLDDDLPLNRTQQSSQGSQNIIIETGHHQDQLNTRHTINVIVNNNKKERQKRYREQNRDKLKQREAERRERIQYSQSIAGPSTSSNTNRIELNNEEIITAQSSSGSEKIQPSSMQRNDRGNELNALQKKRERQQRYREQNRDKLKQREAERRRRLQNADVIMLPQIFVEKSKNKQ